MANKLTESQKLIRRLQTRYTNKEIADILGYKSPSSISRIASGKSQLRDERLSRAEETVTSQKIRKKAPSKKELQEIRKNRKKKAVVNPDNAWVVSSYSKFINGVQPKSETALQDSLTKHQLTDPYVYYNKKLDRFLLANTELDVNDIDNRDITNFLFYFGYEVHNTSGKVIEVVDQYPLYAWRYIIPRNDYKNSGEVDKEIKSFEASHYDADHMDKGEDHYSYMNMVETAYMVAFVSLR